VSAAKKKKATKKKGSKKPRPRKRLRPELTPKAWMLLGSLEEHALADALQKRPRYSDRTPAAPRRFIVDERASRNVGDELWILQRWGYVYVYRDGPGRRRGEGWSEAAATDKGLRALKRHRKKKEGVAMEKANVGRGKKKNPMATADEMRDAIVNWMKDRNLWSADSIGFWTPEQWEERRPYEGPPLSSGFVVYAEGTRFNHALAYGDSPGDVGLYRGWEALLKQHGWWWDALTVWAFYVYPAEDSLTKSNPAGKKPKRGAARAAGPGEIQVVVGKFGVTETRTVPVASVEGEVLAVHPSIRSLGEIERGTRKAPSEWSITHTPSGQVVATVRSKDWARRLAKEIAVFSDPGLQSPDPRAAANAIGGPGLGRVKYILHVARQSREPKSKRGKFPTFKQWQKTATELDDNPSDLATQAAVAAAVGSLIGGIAGALGGAVILGVVGAGLGGAASGASGAATGAVVGGVYGVPLGSYIGTIWGAVRQTGKALEGYPAGQARVLAGLGAGLTGPFAPAGAAVGAYIGAPKE
jgi:hypothetical protein